MLAVHVTAFAPASCPFLHAVFYGVIFITRRFVGAGNGVLPLANSNAPISAAVPDGRGCPSKSTDGAFAVLPLSIAGELLCRWKLDPNSSTKRGSAVSDPTPQPLPLRD